MKEHILKGFLLSISAVMVLSITGCNDDDDSSNDSSISGRAIDGYLMNSKVFLDLTGDDEYNATIEPFTKTDENGSYSLSLTDEQMKAYPEYKESSLILSGGIDSDTRSNFDGILKALYGNEDTHITPLTTMVEAIVKDGNKTVEEAEKITREMLGLPKTADLKADVIEEAKTDSSLLKASLQLQKSLEVLAHADGDKDISDLYSSAATTLVKSADANESVTLNETLTKVDKDNAEAAIAVSDSIDEIIPEGIVTDTAVIGTKISAVKDVIVTEVVDNGNSVSSVEGKIDNTIKADFSLLHAQGILESIGVVDDDELTKAKAVQEVLKDAGMSETELLPHDEEIKALKENEATKDVGIKYEAYLNPAPKFTSKAVVSVNENQLTAITLESDDSSATFSIGGTDAKSFDVNATTGVVVFKTKPDYEKKTSYSFDATVTDSFEHSRTQAVTIKIIDIDENAPVFDSNATAIVDEGQKSAITLSSNDANAKYSISEKDASKFDVDADTGVVTFKKAPVFSVQSSYAFKATATDADNNKGHQDVTITLNDLTAPEFTSDSDVSALEGQKKAITLVSDDKTATFSIKDGNSSSFDVDTKSGEVTFKTAPKFGDEAYTFTATATDPAKNSTDQNVTITITYVDTMPPTFTSAESVTVKENQTTVVTLKTDDENATYSISGTDADEFSVDSKTGVVTFKTAPDYETKSSYTFTATATDKAGNSTNQTVIVTIENVNEAPTIEAIADVNGTVGTAITDIKVNASDKDADTMTYTATGLPDGLSIDGATGTISGTPTVVATSSVTVNVSDGTLDANSSFSISISKSLIDEELASMYRFLLVTSADNLLLEDTNKNGLADDDDTFTATKNLGFKSINAKNVKTDSDVGSDQTGFIGIYSSALYTDDATNAAAWRYISFTKGSNKGVNENDESADLVLGFYSEAYKKDDNISIKFDDTNIAKYTITGTEK